VGLVKGVVKVTPKRPSWTASLLARHGASTRTQAADDRAGRVIQGEYLATAP